MIVPVPLGARSYVVHVQPGALANPGGLGLPPAALPGEIALFSNATVAPLYAEQLAQVLAGLGQRVMRFDMTDGEGAKSLETVGRAYDALAADGFTRRGAVWGLGGGVTGDVAGFVAASWMRGVPLVQVPTTLLAMTDSSVGGKTGINHPKAKNLIGAFWQPVAVIIDPDALRTLPSRELRSGLAEVVKYGVIADPEFFEWLEANLDAVLDLDSAACLHVIARSCQIKAQVVGDDERESDVAGRRAILNYGHTVGHALEAVVGYGQLLHGEAISIGMTVAARLARKVGTIASDPGNLLLQRQTALLRRAGLPVTMPNGFDESALWAAMALDKKTRGGCLNFVLPVALGEVRLFRDVPPQAVQASFYG